MAFSTGYLADPRGIGSGERFDPKSDIVLAAKTFEDNIVVGRFAKIDSGSLDNMDGSASPVIGGIVLRKASRPVEYGSTVDADMYDQVDYGRAGLFTVDAKDGETPSLFDPVYASNAGDADDGKATVTNTDEAARGEYIETVSTGVWLVRLY